MNEETHASFTKGQQVTYGSHGICTVKGTAVEKILGEEVLLVLIELGTGQIVKVPATKAKSAFTPVAKLSRLVEVLAILGKAPKARAASWHHTEREYAKTLGTNDPLALAALVRDLHPGDQPLGTELVQLYRVGLYQLVQLLEAQEGSDVPTILKQFSEASGLSFRPEDAWPSTYAARQRSRRVKSSTQQDDDVPMVKLSKVRPVAALPLPAEPVVTATPVVKKQVVPKAPPAPTPPATRVMKLTATPPSESAAKAVVPRPVAIKAAAVVLPSSTPQPLKPTVSPAATTPPAKTEKRPVDVRPVVTDGGENKELRETIAQLQAENKKLREEAGTARSLREHLEASRATALSLRLQLTARDQAQTTTNQERQQRDREQATLRKDLERQVSHLTELVGVLLGTAFLFASNGQEKLPSVTPVEGTAPEEQRRVAEIRELKQALGRARSSNTKRKRRVEELEADLKRLKRALGEAEAAKEAKAAEEVEMLLKALVDKKQEIETLTTTIQTQEKEVLRLSRLVARHEKTIVELKADVLTAKQVRAEIARVRAYVLQYIDERTGLVERLQAYIQEQKKRREL